MTQITDKVDSLTAGGFVVGPPVDTAELDGPNSGKYRRYLNATIYYSPATGAHEIHGDIRATYDAMGGLTGSGLGYPRTDELPTPDNWGRYNDFEVNSLYWDGRHGYPAYVVAPAPSPSTAPASTHGRWETATFDSGVVGVHAALLPGSKVLFFTYLEPPAGTAPSPQRYGDSALLDLRTGYITRPSYTGEDGTIMENLFCAGHAFLEDGSLLVAGGEREATGVRDLAVRKVHVFGRTTSGGWAWRQVGNCARGRWYGQCATLPDGRVLMIGGNVVLPTGNYTFEIYDPTTGTISPETPAPLTTGSTTYPFVFVLPSNKVLVHSYTTTSFLDLASMTFSTATLEAAARPDRASRTYGVEGTAVLLPLLPTSTPPYRARVLMMGGGAPDTALNINTPATNTCEILDLGEASPAWRLVAPMAHRRVMPDSVLLPDGKVLVVNGSRAGKSDLGADPVYPAEIYDPATNTWTTVATMSTARLYHATALLLPDGRVMTAGTDSAWNPVPYNLAQLRIEIYSPPYLFAGTRPTITSAPATIGYDSEMTVSTPNAGGVTRAALVRCGSTTHSFNTDQRYVGLTILGRTSSSITFATPPDGTIAPPGYYLLFLLNGAGVPSLGKYVKISTAFEKLHKEKEKDKELEKLPFHEKLPSMEKLRHPEKLQSWEGKYIKEKDKDAEGFGKQKDAENFGVDPRMYEETLEKVRALEHKVELMSAFIQRFERPAHGHTARVVAAYPVTTSTPRALQHDADCPADCTTDHSLDHGGGGDHSHTHVAAHEEPEEDVHEHEHEHAAGPVKGSTQK